MSHLSRSYNQAHVACARSRHLMPGEGDVSCSKIKQLTDDKTPKKTLRANHLKTPLKNLVIRFTRKRNFDVKVA